MTTLVTAQSSLQSNWNASPKANVSGTNVPRPAVRANSCCACRQLRTNAASVYTWVKFGCKSPLKVGQISAQINIPVHQKRILFLDALEAPTAQRSALGMLVRVLHRTLSIRIPDAGRIGDHSVVRERRSVEAIDLELVQIRGDDTLFEIVQNHVADHATKVAEGLFMQLAPGLVARLGHDATEAASRIVQRHHEQPRPTIAPGVRIARGRAFSVVDLRLLAGQELQTVKLLGCTRRRLRTKRLTLL